MGHDPKTLLLIGYFLSSSKGAHSISEDLAARLLSSGWQVLTVSHKNNRFACLLDIVGTIWRKRKEYSLAHVDVYSGQAFVWAEAARAALSAAGKPCVLSLHGGNLPAFAHRWPGRVRRLLRGAVAVTTPSMHLKNSLAGLRNDIQYLPNSLELVKYNFKLRSEPTPKLCWLRAFHHIYNPTMAVRTLALLVQEFPTVRLEMIGPDRGDGSLEQVETLAADLGVTGNLTIAGAIPKEQVAERLNQSDIFLNTTNYESFGVSVMEAGASGMCIVTTDVGEIPLLWRDGEEALLVPPDNHAVMAAGVRRILTEPDLPGRLSSKARRKAEQFDWSFILSKWEELLRKAAGGQGP